VFEFLFATIVEYVVSDRRAAIRAASSPSSMATSEYDFPISHLCITKEMLLTKSIEKANDKILRIDILLLVPNHNGSMYLNSFITYLI
jgi:hypothetical protein